MSESLAAKLWKMDQPRILVVGDWIEDVTLHGRHERFAQEDASVPVFRVQRRETRPGGAGAVVSMCNELGAVPVSLAGLPWSVKTRCYVDGRLVSRHDEDAVPLGSANSVDEDEYAEWIGREVKDVAAVLVADYGAGTCTPKVLRAAIDGAAARGIPCIVDPARECNWHIYKGCTAIKCNQAEWGYASAKNPWWAGWKDWTDNIVVTGGSKGVTRFGKKGIGFYPARPRNAICVLGCGDMVLSSLGVCLAGGMSWDEACTVANAAAGLKTTKRGAVPVSRAEVCLDLLGGEKLLPDAELLRAIRQVADERQQNVVWTNGVYDLLHPGHLHCLREAKKQGDVLVVGVNVDSAVQFLKGESRPLVPLKHRIAMLAALGCVDWIVLFGTNAGACIETLRADVLVKGADYQETNVVGASGVLARGGRVHLVPLLDGYSTTALAARKG